MMGIWPYISDAFSPSERWGNPKKVNGLLLLLLFAIRMLSKQFVGINCAWESAGHASNGQHPKGNAVDWHFSGSDIPFYNQIELLETILKKLQVWDRIGIGIYPAWNTPGFHLDVRGEHAEWGWTGLVDEGGNKIYVSYSEAKAFAEKL